MAKKKPKSANKQPRNAAKSAKRPRIRSSNGAARRPKGVIKVRNAKAKEPTAGDAACVVITYDLFGLPSTFHKAGLAGLILLIESLKQRHVLKENEAKYELSVTQATVTFTERLLRRLMDDLYDAAWVELAVKSKWAEEKVARPPTPAEKEAGTPFVYKIVQPKGAFFDNAFDGKKEAWRKLWRDMLWSIPRSRPTTREPYKQRADGQTCKEGPAAWSDLAKVQKARAKGAFYTSRMSSALFPGAQAYNAEQIAFEGRAEQNLLLHFWPLTVLLFVPQQIERDGTSDFVGYTLAVPEVSHLIEFVCEYPKLLDSLQEELRGFRPAQAVIALPAEGALALMDDLATITGLQVETGELRFSIGGVEYMHLVKQGNNVKTMSSGRMAPSKRLLAGYRAIVKPVGTAVRYRNPLFRRGLLIALLDNQPWYRAFGKTFTSFDAELFIRRLRQAAESERRNAPQFANDAARKLKHESDLFTSYLRRCQEMPEADRVAAPRPQSAPAVIINRVVRNYLLTRAADKAGVQLAKFESAEGDIDWKAIPTEFNEAKQKLAQSLFLEFRSRKDQAFVDHFAATFFSVTQRLAEADRLDLAQMLVPHDHSEDRRDDLKTLTLLALSANS